ncbi:hypothetical protein SEA_ACFISHHOOK_78 [Mycobacterium phage ACFishhook]|nr:hypothetical protein SEA_ACFISHHOOK_78 [Mycobacterium phage ACFishhook]
MASVTALKRSNDRKVANHVKVSKSGKASPAIQNTFGLPSGRQFSCTEATDFCSKICYAGNLEKIYKGVSDVLLHNWEALKDASREDMIIMLGEMVAAFVKDCTRRQSLHERADRRHTRRAGAAADAGPRAGGSNLRTP